jgi:hypothetical protein
MNGVRNVALAVGAWLLVVTGGAVLVWTVISQAGEGVAGTPPVVEAEATKSGGRPSDKPSSSASPTSGASPTSDPVRGTWSGAAGLVIAECRGTAIRLVSTQVASGWKLDPSDDTTSELLRVEFETSDERTRVRVEAVCAEGAPTFSADTRAKG